MEKRLFLAIALSLLILLTWSVLMPKQYHVGNKEVINNKSTISSQTAPVVLPTGPTPIQAKQVMQVMQESLVKFPQDKMEIIFDERRAAVKEVIFKANRQHIFPLQTGYLTDDGSFDFRKESINKDSVTFVYQDQIRRITKKFTISKPIYAIDLEITIHNLSSAPLISPLILVLSKTDLAGNNLQSRYKDVFIVTNEKSLHLSVGKNYKSEDVKVLGFRDQYFCTILGPTTGEFSGYIKKLDNQSSEIGLIGQNDLINIGGQIGHSYHIYLGPQELSSINQVNPNWSGIIYFGTFDFIAQLLLQLLGFFYGIVHNWGWAIVILSLVVYALLFPLSLKQMRSMKEMQILQPKIEALRKAHKDDPQKLNKEIMDLYKEHKVNPLGGCLPLLLQMPIFFALYQALIRSVSLRGARFLWIKDLSEPDKLFTFSKSIPLLGSDINILPILMAIMMFIQQKISMAKAEGTAAEQQKMMLIIMPVMFGIIFYNMPSGLVLYWFINSSLMLFYQIKIYRQT